MVFVWLRGGNRVVDFYDGFKVNIDVELVVWVVIDLRVVGDLVMIWVLDGESFVNKEDL